MARDGITFEQVAAVADALVGEGLQPTIRAIRERLGTGSPNTVHKHLAAWREARPAPTAVAPELPAALMAALAAELQRSAAAARAGVEDRLVQAQAEAGELSAAGELLEAERDVLVEHVAALTTERDQATATAAERAVEIARLVEQVEREQKAAESARVEVATARVRAEQQEKAEAAQAAEIERLRATLAEAQQGRTAAEQQAAVLAARFEAMSERMTRAEARVELLEQQAQQVGQELSTARVQVQAQQAALDGAAREVETAKRQAEAARAQARESGEAAAELRGRLAAVVPGKE